jgi:Aldo/keto reductase family
MLARPVVSSVIIAGRSPEQLEDNIRAMEIRLAEEDVKLLDVASDPGVPHPKWMVLRLDTAEEPRSRVLRPERYAAGGGWQDFCRTR